MNNLKENIKEIGRIVMVFLMVTAVVLLVGWTIKQLFN